MWKDEYEKIVAGVAATGGAGVTVAVLRSIFQRRYGGVWQWLSMLAAASLVAVLTGFLLHDSDFSEHQRWAIIGVSAFLADDILFGILAISALFRTDPLGTFTRFWNAIRGRGEEK